MTSVEVNGPAIRALRIALRVPIEQVAREVGVSRAYLCKIELGHSRKVSVETLGRLEEALGVTDRRALLASPYPAATA
ncbi:MAG: helix-turn-helix transcriptional regulator [Frankiales bacterium]|nr:helix-turn-helix transcriptional regulator [Frankiales bacterium]